MFATMEVEILEPLLPFAQSMPKPAGDTLHLIIIVLWLNECKDNNASKGIPRESEIKPAGHMRTTELIA
jgi:hypothetical protein